MGKKFNFLLPGVIVWFLLVHNSIACSSSMYLWNKSKRICCLYCMCVPTTHTLKCMANCRQNENYKYGYHCINVTQHFEKWCEISITMLNVCWRVSQCQSPEDKTNNHRWKWVHDKSTEYFFIVSNGNVVWVVFSIYRNLVMRIETEEEKRICNWSRKWECYKVVGWESKYHQYTKRIIFGETHINDSDIVYKRVLANEKKKSHVQNQSNDTVIFI